MSTSLHKSYLHSLNDGFPVDFLEVGPDPLWVIHRVYSSQAAGSGQVCGPFGFTRAARPNESIHHVLSDLQHNLIDLLGVFASFGFKRI